MSTDAAPARGRWLRRAAVPAASRCSSPRRPRLVPGEADGLTRAVGEIGGDGRPLSLSLQILLPMSLLSGAAVLLVVDRLHAHHHCVLSILRHALGLQQTPPNQVLVRLSLFPVAVRDAACAQRGEPRRDHPLWSGTDRHRRGGRAVGRCAPRLHDEADAQDRPDDVRQDRQGARIYEPEGRPLFDPAARLRHQRTQDRLPDRLPDLSALPRHRPDRRIGADVARHDDAVADSHIDAVQTLYSSSSSTAGP